MKALFINLGVYTIYGATRSLSELTKHWTEKFDMMVPLTFPDHLLSFHDREKMEKVARESYGKNLDHIYFMWLPTKFPINVEYRDTFKWKIKHTLIYIFGLLNRKRIYRIIEEGNYDLIHLNSVILYPLLSEKYPMYIHIREIVDRNIRSVVQKLKLAKGIFFIDSANEIPFAGYLDQMRCTTMINPFDMSRVREVHGNLLKRQMGLMEEERVFMIAGNVSAIKGVDFVIQSFVRTSIQGRLLIVGAGDGEYVEKCKNIAKGDKRIMFCGERKDMIPLFAICDYVVRGDAVFGFGRTNYEALYAGRSVITPGRQDNIETICHYNEYKEHIFFYEPRSMESLINCLKECSLKEIKYGEPIDTSITYAKEFLRFVKK